MKDPRTTSRLKFDRGVAWAHSGLRIEYKPDGLLMVEDLNPQVEIRNVLSRWDVVRLGLHLIRKALVARASRTESGTPGSGSVSVL